MQLPVSSLAHRLPQLTNSSTAATPRARTSSPTTTNAGSSPSPVGRGNLPNPNSNSQSNTQARRIMTPIVRTATSKLITCPGSSPLIPQAPEAALSSGLSTQPTQPVLSASRAVNSEQMFVDQVANTFKLQPGSREHLILFNKVRFRRCFPLPPIDYSDVRWDYPLELSQSLHLPGSHEVPYLG